MWLWLWLWLWLLLHVVVVVVFLVVVWWCGGGFRAQTSSGKTYSMIGENESQGIIPLSLEEIFDTIKKVVSELGNSCFVPSWDACNSSHLLRAMLAAAVHTCPTDHQPTIPAASVIHGDLQ